MTAEIFRYAIPACSAVPPPRLGWFNGVNPMEDVSMPKCRSRYSALGTAKPALQGVNSMDVGHDQIAQVFRR